MNGTEAFKQLTKDQVIHLIIWQMFEKKISLEELTAEIKEKEKEIIKNVNKHLIENLDEDQPAPDNLKCPKCNESNINNLILHEDFKKITCIRCGNIYDVNKEENQ